MVDGDFEAARSAYESMALSSDQGAPLAEVGLGDLAIFTGDFEAGREHLRRAVELATADDNQYVAATALHGHRIRLRGGRQSRGRAGGVGARAARSKAASPGSCRRRCCILRPATLEAAAEIAADLTNQLQPQTRAYGTLIEGLIAHSNGRIVEAIEKLSAALELADFWLIRFYLGQGLPGCRLPRRSSR